MSDLLKLRRDQLQAFLGDDEDAIRAFELLFDRVSNPYPVGATYVQFPAAETNVIADAFPESEEPATLFGGTWEEQFTGESSIAFRTVGNETTIRDDGRTNGLQSDAIRNITGYLEAYGQTSNVGVFSQTGGFGGAFTGTSIGLGNRPSGFRSGTRNRRMNFAASGSVPTGEDNRMTNRLIKVWKRTA